MILKPDEQMVCPHCERKLKDKADRYPVPGRVGEYSRAVDTCEWCDEPFFAMRIDHTGNIEVWGWGT